MKVLIDKDYKAGETLEISNPNTDQVVTIELPQDYEANSWIEVPDPFPHSHIETHTDEPNVDVSTNSVSSTLRKEPESPVKSTVVTHYQQPVYVSPPVTVAAQPTYVYQAQPRVIVIQEEEKKGLDERDCCAVLLGACLCSCLLRGLLR